MSNEERKQTAARAPGTGDPSGWDARQQEPLRTEAVWVREATITQQTAARAPVALAARWQDPVPVVVVITVLWLLGLAASLVSGHWAGWGQACLAGLVVGALGFALFLSQRRAARRGDRTAQRGL